MSDVTLTPAKSPRLLIVDDDPLIRLLARERLGSQEFEVHEAVSGAQGVEAFADLVPDLVLLDVEMPEMNGFEVCRAIRETRQGQHVPVLILTGRDDLSSIEEAYSAGATDFLTKPLNWVILEQRIRYVLRASESFMAVREQQVRLDEVQRHARLGSWEIDLRTSLFTASSSLRMLVDMGPADESAPIGKVLDLVHSEDRPLLERAAAEALMNQDGFSLEHRVVGRDGSQRVVHSQARVRTGAHDEALALEGFTQDITELRQTEEQVRLLAFSDSLTGLSNRAALKLHLQNAIHRSSRSGRSIGVLYLDLDQFKRVNDTFGHTAGDELLQEVARRLSECIRGSDLVARNARPETDFMVSRLGGDEFTILVENLAKPSDAGVIAERVLEALGEPTYVEGHEIRTTASIGIAICPEDGADVESLLRNGDSAMYQAKKRGRANFQFYREVFNSQALERLELEASLLRAIESDQLFVHFQPKLELATGRIAGCEALARWHDPQRGPIGPASFVPMAESSGLISNLGEAVLRRACLAQRSLQRLGYEDLELAVNLSPGQIRDERLIETIDAVLEETGFDPTLLDFEITETALIHDAERAVAVLGKLRDRGCRVSLDDFGTGYSSLSSLKRFPVECVKIDRYFISGIGSSKEDEAITEAILNMAQSIGIRVVAEGVETYAQLCFLRERGCDEVQGFLISRPLGLDAFEEFLQERGK